MWVEIQLFSLRRRLKNAYCIYLKNEEQLKHIRELMKYEVAHTET